jgi:hypothetical protein
MKNKLALAGVVAIALLASGCNTTSAQRCAAYKAAYDKWIAAGKPGGEAEEKAAGAAYKVAKLACSLRGIDI